MVEHAAAPVFEHPTVFFRAFYPKLFRFVWTAGGGCAEEVEDLVQETLLHAWKNRDRFRGESNPMTWMTAIARNKVRDRLRAIGRDQRAALTLLPLVSIDEAPLPREVLESAETRRRVRQALSALPADHVDLLRRKYLLDQSVRQIAAEIDETEKAVESRLQRAREQFRKLLSEPEESEDPL